MPREDVKKVEYKILDKINSPEALRAVNSADIPQLSSEIRHFLIDKVGSRGGHLASNLGVVELTLAMHRVFDSPRDHFIFDVGHQAYVHKIITGRGGRFDELRTPGGLSGFTSPTESVHDAFGAGHSSTSVSAGLGFARADRLSGSDAYTVCVIGDGSFTGGMAHEALNNVDPELRLVVILNENGMSISMNKGAFASYLARVRISKGYVSFKEGTRSLLSRLPLGRQIAKALSFIKSKIKRTIYPLNYFEELGFYYIGTVDGNDYKAVEHALAEAKRLGKAVVVHVKTQKGKGYNPAENAPDEFHSIAKSDANKASDSYHSVFSDSLIKLAEGDGRICAVSAAMGIGTGLSEFGKVFPSRYFDVGIAEGHALTFSAGLAKAGYKPYTAIYSTFLQRGYDSIVHDIALQGLPVRMLVDRAGLAAADGATHHGIFDVAFLSHIPNVEIYSPSTYGSLRAMLADSTCKVSPMAIRYPNKAEDDSVCRAFYPRGDYENYGIRCDFSLDSVPENIIISYGAVIKNVLSAKKILLSENISVGTVLVERIKPYSEAVSFIREKLPTVKNILYVEEGIKNGGAGMITRDMLTECGYLRDKKMHVLAIDDNFVIPDKPTDIYDYAGLSAEKIAKKFKECVNIC